MAYGSRLRSDPPPQITAHHPAHSRRPPLTLKERAAELYARRQLGRVAHERRVLSIATNLFDLALANGSHQLEAKHRRVLRLAALLHDVGRRFGEKNHPADGARMIEEDGYLPLSAWQRRAVAYLTRYHRGAVPAVGYDDPLKRGDGRKALRAVLALLRAADSLDSRQLDAPSIAIAIKGKRLSITCFVSDGFNRARKVFKRRKKFRLLEEMMGMKVSVDVRAVNRVAHV
jgi:exopolyphosphatase / guanosine-5'-triphosphate,3'-diphosphate pyrophosphatase